MPLKPVAELDSACDAAIVARAQVRRIGAEHEHRDEGERTDRDDEQHRSRRKAPSRPIGCRSRRRSCAPGRGEREIGIGARALRASRPRPRRGRRTGCVRRAARCSRTARAARPGMPATRQARGWSARGGRAGTAAGDILDRAEQQVVDRLGEAPFASERVGFLEPGARARLRRAPTPRRRRVARERAPRQRQAPLAMRMRL